MRKNFPADTGRKLNGHKTSRTTSERLMYLQFTSCVYGVHGIEIDGILNLDNLSRTVLIN